MTDEPEPTRVVSVCCKAHPDHGWDAPVLTGTSVREWADALGRQVCPICGAPYEVTSQRDAV